MNIEHYQNDFIAKATEVIINEGICEIDILRHIMPRPPRETVFKTGYQNIVERFAEADSSAIDLYIDESGDGNIHFHYKKLHEDIVLILRIFNKTIKEFKKYSTYNELSNAIVDLNQMKYDEIKLKDKIKTQIMLQNRYTKKNKFLDRLIETATYEYTHNLHRLESRDINEEAYLEEKVSFVHERENAQTELLKLYYQQKISKIEDKIKKIQFLIMDEESIHLSAMGSIRFDKNNYISEMHMWSDGLDIDREHWENKIFTAKVMNERLKLNIFELQQTLICRTDQIRDYLAKKLQKFSEEEELEENIEPEEIDKESQKSRKIKEKKGMKSKRIKKKTGMNKKMKKK